MKSTYNWNAEDYAKNSSAQLKWANELIGKLNLLGNERILDIGSGDGKITAKLAELVPKGSVLGIDSSLEMIQLAKQSFPYENHSNLSFECMDVLNMTFYEEFDVIFSNACLHWVKDHQKVLKNVDNALKHTGRILFQMGGKGNAAEIVEIVENLIHSSDWSIYFDNFSFPYGFYSDEEYYVWLRDTSLKPTNIQLIPKDMVQKGREGLAGWLRTTWLPHLNRLPEEKRTKFIDSILDLYIPSHPLDLDGNLHVNMIRLEVSATK